jgi:hypothetical protein
MMKHKAEKEKEQKTEATEAEEKEEGSSADQLATLDPYQLAQTMANAYKYFLNNQGAPGIPSSMLLSGSTLPQIQFTGPSNTPIPLTPAMPPSVPVQSVGPVTNEHQAAILAATIAAATAAAEAAGPGASDLAVDVYVETESLWTVSELPGINIE